MPTMKIETIAIHAGNHTDQASGAVIQPITLSSTFERGADGAYPSGFMYSRADNPNRQSLENVLAQLEGGADACAFASGNAAGSAVFQALAPGSHVLAPDDMYHGLRNSLLQVFKGILEVDFIDMTNLDLVSAAIKPNTQLIWLESPSNPLLKISDIKSIAHLAKAKNILLAVDNTFATPILQCPLALGADLVMHSTTKYLGGHSDVIGGALVCKEKNELWDKIRTIQSLSGAVPAPFDCYMTVRGIKTLPYRMKGHLANALALAQYLEAHPKVERVYYPGLFSHPQHNLAKTQMCGAGGMLSFLVKDGEKAAQTVCNQVKIFAQATSLGGVESLLEHRASVEGPGTLTPKNLIRVSVGLENIEDLIADMEQALS